MDGLRNGISRFNLALLTALLVVTALRSHVSARTSVPRKAVRGRFEKKGSFLEAFIAKGCQIFKK